MSDTKTLQGPKVDVGFSDGVERNEPPATQAARRKAAEQVAAGRARQQAKRGKRDAPVTVDDATGVVGIRTRKR
jgi:hypothetical protein